MGHALRSAGDIAVADAARGKTPTVVGFGGTVREGSSSERALRASLAAAEAAGAKTILIPARELELPHYRPDGAETRAGKEFIEAIRCADGVIIATPGYHGGISGLVKNALDYIEELRDDARPYLDGRGVGCIACAYGWQATTTTLVSLRSTVHALRGWPTPLGVAINSAEPVFDAGGGIVDPGVAGQLQMLGEQVVLLARAIGDGGGR